MTTRSKRTIAEFERDVLNAAPKAPAPCIGKDPLCPCADGDVCHYVATKKTKAWVHPVASTGTPLPLEAAGAAASRVAVITRGASAADTLQTLVEQYVEHGDLPAYMLDAAMMVVKNSREVVSAASPQGSAAASEEFCDRLRQEGYSEGRYDQRTDDMRLLAFAYRKLSPYTMSNQDDALLLDEIKLILEGAI